MYVLLKEINPIPFDSIPRGTYTFSFLTEFDTERPKTSFVHSFHVIDT